MASGTDGLETLFRPPTLPLGGESFTAPATPLAAQVQPAGTADVITHDVPLTADYGQVLQQLQQQPGSFPQTLVNNQLLADHAMQQFMATLTEATEKTHKMTTKRAEKIAKEKKGVTLPKQPVQSAGGGAAPG